VDSVSLSLVMVAAVMHAGWNLFVKKDQDQFLSLTVMAATSAVLCAVMLPFVGSVAPQSWSVLAISAPLHVGYRVCLSMGYRYGDMSQVYPIARGATPLMVSLISVVVLGVDLGGTKIAGIVTIAAGIMGLTFYKGFPKNNEGRAIAFALGTAAFIAVFTLLDSKGSRLSGNSLAYVLWLFVLEGAMMTMVAAAANGAKLKGYVKANGKTCLVNGIVMSAAHGLIIMALSRSQPALVSALRETSVIFGVIFSWAVLKERVGAVRLACTGAVTGGLLLAILG